METDAIVPVNTLPTKDIEQKEDADSGAEVNSDSGNGSDEERTSVTDYTLHLDDDLETEHVPVPLPRSKNIKKRASSFIENEITNDEIPPVCPFHQDKASDDSLVVSVQEISGNSKGTACNISSDENLPNEAAFLDISFSTVINDVEINDSLHVNDGLVEFYNRLMEGLKVPVDNSVSLESRPDWLDLEKFKRGQKFAIEHLFCVNFAEMLSLMMIFTFKGGLDPLIFSGKSSTPFTAFQRYLSTLLRVKSWYEDDVWSSNTSARQNMAIVRAMHKNIKEKLDSADAETFEKFRTLSDENKTALWCPMKGILLDDFKGACPVPLPGTCDYATAAKLWVNQSDMAITQFAFVGLIALYPEHFGCANVSDDDLDSFVHMWRGLGYLLGIKDEFNFCSGGLEPVRLRTRNIIQYAIKPNFREVSAVWEHMSRCVVEGISYYVPGCSFEVSLQFLCDVLKIHTPRLKKNFSFYNKFMYYTTKFVFNYVLYIPGMLSYYNFLLFKAIKRAQNATPEFLSKLQGKSYEYMNQPGKININD